MRRTRRSAAKPKSGNRNGLSLLEVVLAVAIFLASMTAITGLVSTGTRASVRGQLETEAILRCESKLGEVLAGIEPLESVDSIDMLSEINGTEGWLWSMDVIRGDAEYSPITLDITVQHADAAGEINAMFRLKRIIRDPQLFEDSVLAAEEAAADEEEE